MHKKIIKAGTIEITNNVKITKRNIDGSLKEIKEYKNIVTNVCFNDIIDYLVESGSPTGIDYMAFGNNGTAATVNDTDLVSETFRKLLTTKTRVGQTAVLSVYLSTTEANDTHLEIGLYGNGATITPGSGDLFNRIVISETKVNTETWTVEVVLSFANGV